MNINFETSSKEEFTSLNAIKEPVFEYNTWSKTERVAYDIFSVLFFPLGVWRLLHRLGGLILVPATNSSFARRVYQFDGTTKEFCQHQRKSMFRNLAGDEGAKRISVLVDGKRVDALMVGKKENKTWTLFSGGNGQLMELGWDRERQQQIGTNYLLYNYPGVGSSEGWTTRHGMIAAHQAMRKFLEEKVQAEEIIENGLSIGGGVQGESIKRTGLNNSVHRVFVAEQTFSYLSKVPEGLFGKVIGSFFGGLIKVLGWELSSVHKKDKHPEVVVTRSFHEEVREETIQHDTVISRHASYAKAAIKKKNKEFIGHRSEHGRQYANHETENISAAIKRALDKARLAPV